MFRPGASLLECESSLENSGCVGHRCRGALFYAADAP